MKTIYKYKVLSMSDEQCGKGKHDELTQYVIFDYYTMIKNIIRCLGLMRVPNDMIGMVVEKIMDDETHIEMKTGKNGKVHVVEIDIEKITLKD